MIEISQMIHLECLSTTIAENLNIKLFKVKNTLDLIVIKVSQSQ